MSKAANAGFSKNRLENIERFFQKKYVDPQILPGTLTQIWRRGELVHTGLTGHMDLERNKKMREDTIFRIYSMTKPITAVALMMLVEEGKLGLDDAVHIHIPQFKNLRVYASGVPSLVENTAGQFLTIPWKRPMKVVDLVTHTSGLTYGFMWRTAVDAAYRHQKINDWQTYRVTAGFGLRIVVPMLGPVPIALDFGFPIVKGPGDKEQIFSFWLGFFH